MKQNKHGIISDLLLILGIVEISKPKGEIVNKRVPNYKLSPLLSSFSDFTNYNATIYANTNKADNKYVVWHWNTKVLEYDLTNNKIDFLLTSYRSQTTSALVGKILRALPNEVVRAFVPLIASDYDRKRISRMLGYSYTPEIYVW